MCLLYIFLLSALPQCLEQNKMLSVLAFFFFFPPFFGHTHGLWKFPSQGWNLSWKLWPTPQLGNTEFLTHCTIARTPVLAFLRRRIIRMISKWSSHSFPFKFQIWGWSLAVQKEDMSQPCTHRHQLSTDLNCLGFLRVWFLSSGEVKEIEVEEGGERQGAAGKVFRTSLLSL